MAAQPIQSAPRVNGVHQTNGVSRPMANGTGPARRQIRSNSLPKNQMVRKPSVPKAHSTAGESQQPGVTSAYAIMANRIANRVAEMAESITFVERPKPLGSIEEQPQDKKRPRKLEMRLANSGPDAVSFSAPFLDNTLQKMLALQNRMLKSTAELTKLEGVDERAIREQAAQSAELSRIIALICAEKARQGA